MRNAKSKQYYAVIISVGYGIYDNWDKVKELEGKGFHKKGSHFFHTKKFPNYYDAAEYALQTAIDRCAADNISVANFVIPTVPNQLFFYSRMSYLNPEKEECLRQMLASYQNGQREMAVDVSDVPVPLVEFADKMPNCQ